MTYRTLIAAAFVGSFTLTALAQGAGGRVASPVAEFVGLDKITGQITSFDVYIGETVQFGALQITPRVCNSDEQRTGEEMTTFVEVDEVTLDRDIRDLFAGWMFADDPGLSAVDHPVYDVWLRGCKATSEVPPPKS